MARLKIQIVGMDRLMQKLRALPAATKVPIRRAMTNSALEVHAAAIDKIQRPPASGRVYELYMPRRTHQASAPGEPPMSDTGALASSVQWAVSDDGMAAAVGTNLEYGKYLEFGTRRVLARPWLQPAFESRRKSITKRIAAALVAVLRKVPGGASLLGRITP